MFLFNRYILGFLFAIGLIILIVVLLFSGSGGPSSSAKRSLTSYANDNSSVEMDIYGPIVAQQNHYQVDVAIDQNSAQLNLFQGYDLQLINSKSYHNSRNGYAALLSALYYAGYNQGGTNKLSSLGYCADGDVYTFKLIDNGQLISSYWTTNCAGTPRTYTGGFSQTSSLFIAQIPDYSDLISGTNF